VRLPAKIAHQADEPFIITQWKLAVEGRNPNMVDLPKLKKKQVAPRQIKKLVKYKSDKATDEIFSQQK
jgi:hypothetical protein